MAACTACVQAQNRGKRGRVACVRNVTACASHPNDSFDRSPKLPLSELIAITVYSRRTSVFKSNLTDHCVPHTNPRLKNKTKKSYNIRNELFLSMWY